MCVALCTHDFAVEPVDFLLRGGLLPLFDVAPGGGPGGRPGGGTGELVGLVGLQLFIFFVLSAEERCQN